MKNKSRENSRFSSFWVLTRLNNFNKSPIYVMDAFLKTATLYDKTLFGYDFPIHSVIMGDAFPGKHLGHTNLA